METPDKLGFHNYESNFVKFLKINHNINLTKGWEQKISELNEACMTLQGTDVKDWAKLSQLVVDIFKRGADLGRSFIINNLS